MPRFSVSIDPLRHTARLFMALMLLLLATPSPAASALVQHRLEVQIDPSSGVLTAQDQMRLPEGKSEWPLILHRDLDPRVVAGDATLTAVEDQEHLTGYRLHLRHPGPVTLAYRGRIRHDLERIDESLGRAREWSRGTIAPDGVFLDGNSGWYPRVPGTQQAFALRVQLPADWRAVSQGAGPGDGEPGVANWSETHPQDDIHLIAAPFQLYREPADGFEAQVYLRQPDPALAQSYLDATRRYVRLYSDLIGPYPFAKFALVENVWESGYGMPSFTLLGPQVLRMPFIIQTSYPHEILHNWWGNGVYVDYGSGNWSEGLTNYLADYWLMEQAGRGVEARRDMLKGYADYVRRDKDFPLVEFTERHGSDSQAIGYGKGAMFFHMLRRQLGDDRFKQGLRRFYADNLFRPASYADLRRAFEVASGRDLSSMFAAWTQRSGAPRLALGEVQLTQQGDGFKVTGQIEQTQAAEPFPLQIPVVIDAGDRSGARHPGGKQRPSHTLRGRADIQARAAEPGSGLRCLSRIGAGGDAGHLEQPLRRGCWADPTAFPRPRCAQAGLSATRRVLAARASGLANPHRRGGHTATDRSAPVAARLGEPPSRHLRRSSGRVHAGCRRARLDPRRHYPGRDDGEPGPDPLERWTTAGLDGNARRSGTTGPSPQAATLREIQLSGLSWPRGDESGQGTMACRRVQPRPRIRLMDV